MFTVKILEQVIKIDLIKKYFHETVYAVFCQLVHFENLASVIIFTISLSIGSECTATVSVVERYVASHHVNCVI